MSSPTLYLFIGYPGAGKTTIARLIAERTGAYHLWADAERHKLFKTPTHSLEESNQLYDTLNASAEYLLKQGRSVVFDTNFNFASDRDKLTSIAKAQGAKSLIIWVTTPLETAKKRSVYNHESRNGYPINMSEAQFDSIAAKLEAPTDKETFIKVDGTELDEQSLSKALNLDK